MRNNKINIILVCILIGISVLCIILICLNKDIKNAGNNNLAINESQPNQEEFYRPPFEYNNNKYYNRNTKISKDNILKKIGRTNLIVYKKNTEDNYIEEFVDSSIKQETYNKTADLFSIKNISEECAIAVKFEGENNYDVYVQPNYKPTTLGNFMEDLNLKEITSFGTVSYDYYDKDVKESVYTEFYNVDNNIIWDKLFSDLSLKTLYDDSMNPFKYSSKDVRIHISVNIPILGYKNISIDLSDTGYLQTNILDLGKNFYIGEEKVKDFLDYIKENYEGHKIEFNFDGNVIYE
ncbi:hypothetical protein [Thomasclavelia cocleata]|uniref:hypothetical protein n=1 Tax=Thomasclavelia cocleata TaxID=69824 RepID=UPI0025583843|nr:hypothetical protein [Thomasclavelia cocleata]